MKKFITLIISCSMALAAGAMAQQPDEAQATPGKKKQQKQQAKANAAADAQAPSGAQAERPADRPQRGMKAQERRAGRQNARAEAPANAPDTVPAKGKKARAQMQAEAPATDSASTTTDLKAQGAERRKDRKAAKASETATSAEATTAASPAAAQTKAEMRAEKRAQRQNQGQAQTDSTAATQATQTAARPGQANAKKMKQLDTQTVQKIKTEHANFEAKARPQQVPAVTFSQSRTIEGSQNWQGENYTVFRSYRPERHDQAYYRSRYSRVELIGGGYYYFNAGYWYPAWGYQPSAQYYVYDGPIYAGRSAERLDRVIANVQASLQVQGYYTGEVDGLLGPLTRQALIGYQTDHGLYTTAAIDEPTLNALQLN